MSRVEERRKQRFRYLRKKRIAYGWAAAGAALFVLACRGTLAIAISMGTVIAPQFSLYFNHHFGKLMMALQLVFYPVLMTLALGYLCGFQIKRAASIPYVPRVSVNGESLPADEVLVRPSDEPSVAQQDVLLRAARPSQESREELLRAAENERTG